MIKTEFNPHTHCNIIEGRDKTRDIVILHGINSSKAKTQSLQHFLQKNIPYNIIACDARGHGTRERIGNKTDWLATLHDYESFLKTRPTKKILIGHSMGGALAIALGEKDLNTQQIFAIGAPHDDTVFTTLDFLSNIRYKSLNVPEITNILPNSLKNNEISDLYLIYGSKDKLVPITHLTKNKEKFHVPEKNTLILSNKVSWFAHERLPLDKETRKFILTHLK